MKWTKRRPSYPTQKQLAKYACPDCGSHDWAYAGYDRLGERRMICECGRTFNKRTSK